MPSIDTNHRAPLQASSGPSRAVAASWEVRSQLRQPSRAKKRVGVLHTEDWDGAFYRALSAVCPGVALLAAEIALHIACICLLF